MRIEMLKGKIHRATVTGADLNYEGSISICPDLLAAAKFKVWERVDIYNVTNGARLSTYIIEGKRGEVCLNGAAARLVHAGDLVIIASYCSVDESEADAHQPTIVLVDEHNRPKAAEAHRTGGAHLN